MTFHSLYRLEKRGLLDCPIVGVAVDDWSPDDLRKHAREAIEASGEHIDAGGLRPPGRPDVLPARRLHRAPTPTSRVAAAIKGDVRPRCSTWRSRRRCSAWSSQGLADAGLVRGRPGRGGEAVRPRPRLRRRARRRAARVPRRVADLPDRPLPRQDGPGGAAVPALRQHHPRAGVEPQLRRVGPDHHGRGASASRTADTSTTRSARCATWWSTTSCRSLAAGAMEAPAGHDPDTLKNAPGGRCGGRSAPRRSGAVRARPVRRATRTFDGVAPDSTTETYAALRLDIDNWRWSGVPFFIRTGKWLPATQTEFRLVFREPPRLGLQLPGDRPTRGRPAGRSSWIPTTGIRFRARGPPRGPAAGREPITPGHGVRRTQGGEGPTPYEVLLHAALIGNSTRFTRQDGVEETVADHAAAAGRAAAGARPTSRAPWGPEAAQTSCWPDTAAGTARGSQ